MSVRWKLGIGFSLVVLMLWLTVAVVLWSIHAVNVEIELTANNIIPGAMAMSEMDQAAHEAAYELLNRATRDSVGPGEQSAERLRLALRRLAKAAASHLEHEAHVGDPERREARELLARARTLSVAVEALVDASHGEAMELDGERVHSALDSLVTLLRNHRTTHLQELDVAIGSVGRAHTTVVRTIIPLALLMTFFAAMGAWLTARSLARSLQVLHASELRQKRLSSMLRLMCDNLPAFIWAKDLQNRFLFANKACCADLLDARDTDEPLGKDGMFFAQRLRQSHPQDPDYYTFGELCSDSDKAVLESRTTMRVEEAGNVKGRFLVLDVVRAPFWDDEGNLIGTVGSARDVTREKETETARSAAEAELRESEERFRMLLEQVPSIAIRGSRLDGTVQYWSHANEIFYQYTREEALGKNVLDLIVPPETQEVVRQAVARAVEVGESPPCGEMALMRKDGSRIPVFSSHAIVRRPGRDPEVFCVDVDLSALKHVEQERERLMLAIEQAAEEVVITDVQGVIQYANPAFEGITGYTRAEAIGQNPRILKSGQHDAAFYKDMWDTLTAGRTWSGQFINKKCDGTLYTEEATISPVRNASGDTVNYVAVKRDVTQELQLEDQLRQAQKMEAIGQLAGGVAHDFNNLLQVINGCSELALMQMDAEHPAVACVEEVAEAGERARTLVRQLLAFSRRQVLEMEDVDLNDVVAGVMKMIRRVIGEHIALDILPGHDLSIVHADPGQIEQILMNLCVNARDAMPEGGTITIRTENVRVDSAYCQTHSWATPGQFALLSVSDTGCGMDQGTLSNIFEPFFTTKGAGEGTGLGLSTVYGLVKQHKGMLHARSQVGQGTTLSIYLPPVERSATSVADNLESAALGGTETILLAEDDLAVLTLTKGHLEDAGYTVLAAGDGAEALQVFQAHQDSIDLALFDVVMPRLGGKAVMERVRGARPDLRFLFTTGYSMDSIHTGFVLDEGLNLLQKPYQRDALLRKVREVLDAA